MEKTQWIDTIDLAVSGVNNSVNYIRFTENPKDKRIRMTIGKKLKDFASSKNLGYIQFGINKEENKLIVRLNDEGEGFALLNNKGKHKNFLLVGNIIEYVKENLGLTIKTSQRFQLDLINSEEFVYEVQIPVEDKTATKTTTKATTKATTKK